MTSAARTRRLERPAALSVALCILALAGCASGTNTQNGQSGTRRIISLAPSLTETAFAIRCGPELVADASYDDYPAPARALPHVADLKSVDLERVAILRPTLVLALHDQERQGSIITARLGVPVVYLPNRNLDDLYADIAGVAAACDRKAQGDRLAAQLRVRIAELRREAAARSAHPRVLYLLGLPGFTVGKRSYIGDLIGVAGGINVAGGIDQAYPDLSDEAIVRADPDIIIVAHDTPFTSDVRAREPWRSLRAVRENHVVTPPDDSVIERNGPRVVEGLRWLSAVFAR